MYSSPTDTRRASSRLARWTLLSMIALPLTAGKLKLPNPMAGIKEGLRVGYVAGSKVHAYQSYAFVYGFAQGNTMSHQRALDRLERDGLPLMAALRDAGLRPKLEVSVEPSSSGINVYGVDLVVIHSNRTLTLKRNTMPAYAHKGLLSNRPTLRIHYVMRLVQLDKLGVEKWRHETELTALDMARNEEKFVLNIDAHVKFPLMLSLKLVTHRLAPPSSQIRE